MTDSSRYKQMGIDIIILYKFRTFLQDIIPHFMN